MFALSFKDYANIMEIQNKISNSDDEESIYFYNISAL